MTAGLVAAVPVQGHAEGSPWASPVARERDRSARWLATVAELLPALVAEWARAGETAARVAPEAGEPGDTTGEAPAPEDGEFDDADASAQLVRLGATGAPDAWEALYRYFLDSVTRYVASRMLPRNRDDVPDVVHDAFVLLPQRAGEFTPATASAWGFVRGCCADRALANYRRDYRWRYHVGATEAAIDVWRRGPFESACEREARAVSPRVVTALARLTPCQRRAVQLRYLDGLSEEQSAALVGCRKKTIGYHTERARRQLREALADLAPVPVHPVQEVSKKEAIYAAFEATGRPDVPAAITWLREHGVRVAPQYVYQVKLGQHGPVPAVFQRERTEAAK